MKMFKKKIAGDNTWIECVDNKHYFCVEHKISGDIYKEECSCLSEAKERQQNWFECFGAK